jgi:hypothetical protein
VDGPSIPAGALTIAAWGLGASVSREFALSIPFALVAPALASVTWLLAAPIQAAVSRR